MLKSLRALCALPLLWACATGAPTVTAQSNFELCTRAERACDPARLDAVQRDWIAQRDAANHLEDCLNRRRCNESLLDDAQRQRVRAAVARLNYSACLRGEADCEPGLLDDAQSALVAAAARQRNLENCMGGLILCDAVQLTPAQAREAHAAYLARNFSGCMNTVGTLVECHPEDLTPAQRETVRQRNLAVNHYLCVNNAFGCDLTLLTPEQRAQLPAGGALLR